MRRFLKLVFGLAVLIIFLQWVNIFDAVKYLYQVNLPLFLLALLMIVVIQLFRSARFYGLSRSLGIMLKFWNNVLVHFVASVLGAVTPARLGEGGKVLFFREDKKKLSFCFLLEKLGDFTTLIILALFGLFAFQQYVNSFLIVAVVFVLGVLFLFRIEKILNLVSRRRVFEDKWFRNLFRESRKRGFHAFLITTFFVWLFTVLAHYVFALSLGITIPIILLAQVIGISMTVGYASGSPGGLGVKEFLLTVILSQNLGISVGLIGVYALLVTFGGYLVPIVIGTPSYLWLRKTKSV